MGLLGVAVQPRAQQAAPPATRSAVPVSMVTAARQDVSVWLRGIGTVQAFNAVVVRSRVDGTLMEVPVTEGQEVKKGDVLAVIDPRPFQAALDAATAKRTQDQADLDNARQDLSRYTALEQKSFASHQQVDTQHALVNHLIAAIAGDEAAIETAKLNLSYCYIMSPFQGRVGLRQIDAGNMVHASDNSGIMTITQVRPISVVFTLPQDSLPDVVDMMAKGPLRVDAKTSDGKRELGQGTLLTPDNAIDTTTGTIRLKATFPNEQHTLWPGQFVAAQLLLRTERQVIAVPMQAVQHGQVGLYVYVVKPDSTVQRQPVQAEDRGPVMVITKGLDVGQQIVLDGQSRLDNGTLVAAMTSGAASPREGS